MPTGMDTMSRPRTATTVQGPGSKAWSRNPLIHSSMSGSAASPWCPATDRTMAQAVKGQSPAKADAGWAWYRTEYLRSFMEKAKAAATNSRDPAARKGTV